MQSTDGYQWLPFMNIEKKKNEEKICRVNRIASTPRYVKVATLCI